MSSGQRLGLLEGHELFPAALKIIDVLSGKGFKTVLAGGCVRDSLLGVRPKDLDIATAALPDVVESAFTRTLAVGKAFGTIIVVENGHNFEVTTFRSDGPYLDGRRPSSVEFTDIEEDARRRDFTVNALFYDPREGCVLDFVGGIQDLSARLLRTVGVAEERFGEDRLRMLRAVRFVAQLGFELDSQAMRAIQAQAAELKQVAVERIFNEIRRLLESEHLVRGLEVLRESGLHKVFWPEVDRLNPRDLNRFPEFLNWENAFAAVHWLLGAHDTGLRLREWKVSRESMRRVQAQIEALRVLQRHDHSRAERARILGGEVFAEVLNLAEGLFPADEIGSWVSEYLQVADRKGELPQPFLNGEDLRQAGVPPGQEMGRLLKQVFDAQLEGRVRSKDEALSELNRIRA